MAQKIFNHAAARGRENGFGMKLQAVKRQAFMRQRHIFAQRAMRQTYACRGQGLYNQRVIAPRLKRAFDAVE